MPAESAMVFAAGYGKRMLPITAHTPKPLVMVNGKPLLEYRLAMLEQHGVRNVVINTHHLAPLIQEYIAMRSNKACIELSYEPELLDTGGGLKIARPLFENNTLYVMNSDVLWLAKAGYASALQTLDMHWNPHEMDILLLLHPTEPTPLGYNGNGDFALDEEHRVMRPQNPSGKLPFIYSGLMICKLNILESFEQPVFSLSEVFRKYLTSPDLVTRIRGAVHEGMWLHVGDPAALEAANVQLNSTASDVSSP